MALILIQHHCESLQLTSECVGVKASHCLTRRIALIRGTSATVAALTLEPLPSFAAGTPTSEAAETLVASRQALSSLLQNWDKATIDCSVADVSRDLLEQKNKEELLEKAKTFALFDKDAAVMSCKEDNKKVRGFITRLKSLDKEFKACRDLVEEKGGDLDAYFEYVDKYSVAMSAANTASYSMSMDFASVNSQKMDNSKNREEQVLTGGGGAKDATKLSLEQALDNISKAVEML
ncbi:hypothetical protein TrVE_jg10359 [Triparma verrucosa]|uniref:Uncharacterized protein n=1 Tax=Triparma verrucosa TaxID=1606542 RepID=A0A9W7BRJ2_9STRA|nr:hypothetical protein TrVE_jg10359 [Triparma verrucosa]